MQRSDAQLIQQAQSGGDNAAEAYTALYHRHKDFVWKICVRFTHPDQNGAADAMQETFADFFKRIAEGRYEVKAKITTFLYIVAKHNALAHQRKTRRLTLTDQPLEPSASTSSTTSYRSEDWQQLLKGLSETHQEVILLRFVDDMSLAEIAEATQVPQGTVKTRLHHALKKLRESPNTRDFFNK